MALLTAAEVRERISRGGTPLDSNAYGDTWVDEQVEEFEDLFASWLGHYPAARSVAETLTPQGQVDRLVLTFGKVAAVASVVENAITLAATAYRFESPGILVRKAALWNPDYPVTVTYTSGLAANVAPSFVQRACALYVEKVAAADRSAQSADVRATGDTTWYVMPDPAQNRPTGWREVDRLLVVAKGNTSGVLE